MSKRDFTQIYKKYKGEWVALTPDEKSVVASGKTLKKILEEARVKGYAHPIVMKIPPAIVPYIGTPFFFNEI